MRFYTMEVFIGHCKDYSQVKQAIERGFEKLGGLDQFVKTGETLLVNPNLLQGADPEKAITTHPEFIKAVVELLQDEGVSVIIGDSSGGRMTESNLRKNYEKSGWDWVAEETGAKLSYETGSTSLNFSDGRIIKNINAWKVLDEVDGVINLPKLKTHNLTVYTGAVKNIYGMVHGLTKAAYHGQYRNVEKFSQLLMDVHDAVRPRLTVMDGILGMEGKGPASGDPVNLGTMFISEDSYACDVAACRSVGIPLEKVLTVKHARIDPDLVRYPNLSPDDIKKNIEYPEGGSTPWYIPDFLGGFLANFYLDRPVLDEEKCIRCGECEKICSQDAIIMMDYGPKISWFKCIRCYCCTEVCPEEALNTE